MRHNSCHDSRPKVAVVRIEDTNDPSSIEHALRKSVEDSCNFSDLCKGRKIVLKPNVFCPLPAPVTTDPRVIAALARLAFEAGAAKVTVVEGRSISTALFRRGGNTTRACFEAVGMDKAAMENGADVVYLEEDEFVEVSNPDAEVLKTAHIPRTIHEAEVLINVPVLKNHSLALTTLGIKNLHGTVSDDDKLFAHDYDGLTHKLVDILLYNRPALTVIDGVRGLEGDHAEFGNPIDTGLIISGTDTAAVDAVAEAVMGLENLEVDTTRIAHERGIGVGDLGRIQVLAESLDSVRHTFARPDIEINEERFPGLKVRAGQHCKSCQYYIRRGIDRLVAEGILNPSDPVTIIFGKEPDVGNLRRGLETRAQPGETPAPLAEPEGKVILIGDCALSSESVKRLRNRLWLTGRLKVVYCCPPMEFRMRAVELAGD